MKDRKVKNSPFEIQGLKDTSFTTKNKTVDIVSSENKIYAMQEIGKRINYTKDTLEYVKIYKNSFPVLKNLTTPGLGVFLYVLEVLKPKDTEVYIYPQEAMEWLEYKTPKSVYKGIQELISLSLILPNEEKSNYYYINLNCFYNGKRI